MLQCPSICPHADRCHTLIFQNRYLYSFIIGLSKVPHKSLLVFKVMSGGIRTHDVYLFKNRPNPVSYCLFSFFSNTIFTENHSTLPDSNLDRQSKIIGTVLCPNLFDSCTDTGLHFLRLKSSMNSVTILGDFFSLGAIFKACGNN